MFKLQSTHYRGRALVATATRRVLPPLFCLLPSFCGATRLLGKVELVPGRAYRLIFFDFFLPSTSTEYRVAAAIALPDLDLDIGYWKSPPLDLDLIAISLGSLPCDTTAPMNSDI